MARWLARPYRYADGIAHNPDRYEVFCPDEQGNLVSVGGAIRSWNRQTIAFLCSKSVQRRIHTPVDVVDLTDGMFVIGSSVRRALHLMKATWPSPIQTLIELEAFQDRIFGQVESKKPPQPVRIDEAKQNRKSPVNSPKRKTK